MSGFRKTGICPLNKSAVRIAQPSSTSEDGPSSSEMEARCSTSEEEPNNSTCHAEVEHSEVKAQSQSPTSL